MAMKLRSTSTSNICYLSLVTYSGGHFFCNQVDTTGSLTSHISLTLVQVQLEQLRQYHSQYKLYKPAGTNYQYSVYYLGKI